MRTILLNEKTPDILLYQISHTVCSVCYLGKLESQFNSPYIDQRGLHIVEIKVFVE